MKLVERFQLYVLEPGAIASNGLMLNIPKKLDPDAPFALRGISIRVARTFVPNITYSNVSSLRFRYKNATGDYTSQDRLQTEIALGTGSGGFGGIGGNPGIVYPEIVYPAGGSINVDIENVDANALSPSIYFWGVKLFPEGHIYAPTYPPRCSLLDYRRQLTIAALGLTETRLNIPLIVAGDADYVFRAGQAGCNTIFPHFPTTFKQYHNLLVLMKDNKARGYMDAAVDINYLWGTNRGGFTQGSGFTSNANPGLHVPEIYVPANDFLLFDVFRKDGSFSGDTFQGPNDIQFVFQGSKVYSK